MCTNLMPVNVRLPLLLWIGSAWSGLIPVEVILACPAPEALTRVKDTAQSNTVSVVPRGGPEVVGQWSGPLDWAVIGIHAAVLPTGEVLHYSKGYGEGAQAMTWNPATGLFADVQAPLEIFCSGLTFLEDGNLYVVGGSDYGCLPQGRFETQVYSPFLGSWAIDFLLSEARWYPTAAKLGDGRVLILSGTNHDCVPTTVMEMYTPGMGIEVIPEGERSLELYPRTHLLSSGKLAHVGPEEMTTTWDPATHTWQIIDFSDAGVRIEGSSVLIPGTLDDVMIIGGYIDTKPTASCERMNFADPETGWHATGSLNLARAHANPVILPDGKVLLVGGGQLAAWFGPGAGGRFELGVFF